MASDPFSTWLRHHGDRHFFSTRQWFFFFLLVSLQRRRRLQNVSLRFPVSVHKKRETFFLCLEENREILALLRKSERAGIGEEWNSITPMGERREGQWTFIPQGSFFFTHKHFLCALAPLWPVFAIKIITECGKSSSWGIEKKPNDFEVLKLGWSEVHAATKLSSGVKSRWKKRFYDFLCSSRISITIFMQRNCRFIASHILAPLETWKRFYIFITFPFLSVTDFTSLHQHTHNKTTSITNSSWTGELSTVPAFILQAPFYKLYSTFIWLRWSWNQQIFILRFVQLAKWFLFKKPSKRKFPGKQEPSNADWEEKNFPRFVLGFLHLCDHNMDSLKRRKETKFSARWVKWSDKWWLVCWLRSH